MTVMLMAALVWLILLLGGCAAKTQYPVVLSVDPLLPPQGTGGLLRLSSSSEIVVHEVIFKDGALGLAANIPMHPKPGNYWIISRRLIGDWEIYITAWGWGDVNTLGDRRHIRVHLEPKICHEWYVDDEEATSDFLQIVFVSETGSDLEAMKELLQRGGGVELLRDPRSDI